MASGRKQGLIKARRRLSDLYKRGVEIRFGGRYGHEGQVAPTGEGRFIDEETGEPDPLDEENEVAIWIQPPSPLQRDEAIRDANAARARAVLRTRREEDSEEHLQALEFIETMSDETLFDYVITGEVEERRNEAIREVLADEEWSDITELQESMRIFQEEGREEDDPEVKDLAAREEELQRQVGKREDELREAAYEALQMQGREAAKKKAIERRSELVASRAFMVEYERRMTFYSCRDVEDSTLLFFDSPLEFAAQDDHVLELISAALNPFISDGGDAKN